MCTQNGLFHSLEAWICYKKILGSNLARPSIERTGQVTWSRGKVYLTAYNNQRLQWKFRFSNVYFYIFLLFLPGTESAHQELLEIVISQIAKRRRAMVRLLAEFVKFFFTHLPYQLTSCSINIEAGSVRQRKGFLVYLQVYSQVS